MDSARGCVCVIEDEVVCLRPPSAAQDRAYVRNGSAWWSVRFYCWPSRVELTTLGFEWFHQAWSPQSPKAPDALPLEMHERDDLLIAAVQDGDTDRVRHLLAEGADPNALGAERGRPALFLAAQGGITEIAQALLAAGADPERRDFDGIKAFIAACGAGHDDMARLIANWQARISESALNHHLERLGWSVGV